MKNDYSNPGSETNNNSDNDDQKDLQKESQTNFKQVSKDFSNESQMGSNDFLGVQMDSTANSQTDSNVHSNEFSNDFSNDFETELEDDFEAAENEDWEDFEDELDDELDDDFEDLDFDFENATEEEDILDGYVDDSEPEPRKETVEEVLEDTAGDSAKNLDNLATIGTLILEKLDDFKANVCSAISGKPTSIYASDKRANKALMAAFGTYIATTKVKTPSPLATLILAILVWGAPSFILAFMHRPKKSKEAKKTQQAKQSAPSKNQSQTSAARQVVEEEVEEEVTAEAASDQQAPNPYEHTKEYQEGRRYFGIHKTNGCYQYTMLEPGKHDYCKLSLANELPSPEIQALLDDNLSQDDICKILYES